jgi:hypothetical protein
MKKLQYTLFDGSQPLRTADNVEGLKLSALFHVQNGDSVSWQPADGEPAQVALEYGFVNGKERFRLCVY